MKKKTLEGGSVQIITLMMGGMDEHVMASQQNSSCAILHPSTRGDKTFWYSHFVGQFASSQRAVCVGMHVAHLWI